MMSLLQAIGRAIGIRAAKEVVTPEFVGSIMADEWERVAKGLDRTDPLVAERLRDMAEAARARQCPQRQIGLADDLQYQTLLVVRCDECGLEATVRPGQRKFCFVRALHPSPETGTPHPDPTPTIGD